MTEHAKPALAVIIVTVLLPANNALLALRENINQKLVTHRQTRTESALIVLQSQTVQLVSLVLLRRTRSVPHVKLDTTKWTVPRILVMPVGTA